ncbi:hypothetical protein ABVT39_012066 [Epinephelus coioides]
MMCIILLLIILTSCVCGTFVVNVTQTSYQAEENHNITLEWMFTTKPGSSLHSLYIYCELLNDLRASVLFHLHEGVEIPESQDEQFAGRVQCDKDVLREGRLRLHVSRLRTNDSGLYMCEVFTRYGGSTATCRLTVTGASEVALLLRLPCCVPTGFQFNWFPYRTAADVLRLRQQIRHKFTNIHNILLAILKLQPTSTTVNMLLEKMMCIILLLINLTSCVCGTFVVNVTQTSYQAEENHNITLEWMFTTKPGSSLHSLYIYCELLADLRPSGLFHLHGGVEVPESQDEQFTGRVQCDKEVLREGRLRLHVSRLRTNDSGLYMCEVFTRYGGSTATCRLNVTGASEVALLLRLPCCVPTGFQFNWFPYRTAADVLRLRRQIRHKFTNIHNILLAILKSQPTSTTVNMRLEKMMCIILLLINLTSCVCGTFVVNVTQTSYQAEENHNITLEWMFTTKPGSSLHSLYIYCELLADLRASVLFHLHEGVEVPESQDEQFTGRVQCDKDVLREGRLRLHVSRLRTDDSGLYMCEVFTRYGGSTATCRLTVTAAADEPKPQRPTESPQPESPQPESPQPDGRGRIGLYVGLGLIALLIVCTIFAVKVYFNKCTDKKENDASTDTEVTRETTHEDVQDPVRTFVVNVTQTSYQAEENHNITLEWMFTTKPGSSLHSLYIYCELKTDLRPSVLFRLHGGVEVPESQDEQFTGRVQCDKDVLREGRLRLHVSRLRTDDSGLYMCEVFTRYGGSTATCRLTVTGTFVVNVTQTSYQAEENHNITLEWMFTTKPGSSLHSLYIYCQLKTDLRPSGLFHLHGGVEVPESQDEQFTGRVQCDKDVLREGRLRLHVSRLRTDDSGLYMCQVFTGDGGSTATCRLNVTGTFVVNVTQTSYQAEENHNITLEWMFTTKPGSSLNSLSIYCELLPDLRASVLFHLHEGVEVPESQDEQFTGRVQCDKEVLREGRLRLHVSRLRTNDSGLYMCEVFTRYGGSTATCRLNVTAADVLRLRRQIRHKFTNIHNILLAILKSQPTSTTANMLLEKMMCIILLLINLTSCVCGTFVVNVTQTSYQAEENHNITLEWMFTTKPGSSLHSLYIYCELLADLRASVLFHLHGGVEVPESQDEQFTGRVQCDKDVLREGRLRLHVSRLRTDDSGLYMCEVFTRYGGSTATCRLTVTAAADEPKPQRPTESPQPESPQPESPQPDGRGRIGLYVGLGLIALLIVCTIFAVKVYFNKCTDKKENDASTDTEVTRETTHEDVQEPGEDDVHHPAAHQPDLLCLWEKMMCIILLLINLTSCVCGTFVVNVTQTSYQAEENHNITLEFTFTTKPGSSLHSLSIYCELLPDLRDSVLFHLHEGVEVPESQDEQFTGRVQCDKDVLREGRLRLHVSRLRTDDSGLYMCEVFTRYGGSTATCRLNVTATKASSKPVRPNPTSAPQPESWGWIVLYCLLGLIPAAALLVLGHFLYRRFRLQKWRQRVRQRTGQGQESNNSINTLNNFKPRQPDSCSDHSDGSESAPHSAHASLETAAKTD